MALADLPLELCRKGTPPLTADDWTPWLQELPQWQVLQVDGITQLQRVYELGNFVEALLLTNRIGALAEEADHHPALLTEWGKLQVRWWTHTVRGLHRNDFIMAARCDRLLEAGSGA